jgi:hypothetical protein
VCVEQTAAELCSRGLQVHVVADACTSRSQEDRLLAFEVRVLHADLGVCHRSFSLYIEEPAKINLFKVDGRIQWNPKCSLCNLFKMFFYLRYKHFVVWLYKKISCVMSFLSIL